MTSYYIDTLYPLQDKVLKILSEIKTEFYLTGGTALSRGYLNHRYSDDLDFFVNQNNNFVNLAENILRQLSQLKTEINIKSDTYYSIMVNDKLKIDLVNDSGKHLGKFKKLPLYLQTDNIENILANNLQPLLDEMNQKMSWIFGQFPKIRKLIGRKFLLPVIQRR